uniref:VWFC domain-containing protein n=1 Tax=Macrostomum lignano TaxID=282301 RepID=A0A1I8J889_9PLAT
LRCYWLADGEDSTANPGLRSYQLAEFADSIPQSVCLIHHGAGWPAKHTAAHSGANLEILNMRLAAAGLALLAAYLLSLATQAQQREVLEVRRTSCSQFNGGQPPGVASLHSMPCHKCFCNNDRLICTRQVCEPVPPDCHVTENNGCCESCRSCRLELRNGRFLTLPHGQAWHSADEPCQVFRCFGCTVKNMLVSPDQNVRPFEDQSVVCRCEGGMLSCFKDACQLVNCPPAEQTHSGHCLACSGAEARAKPAEQQCLFQGQTYSNTTAWSVDRCTDCSCRHGTIVCRRQNCPVLECAEKDYFQPKGDCCPVCRDSRDCVDPSGRRYKVRMTSAPGPDGAARPAMAER